MTVQGRFINGELDFRALEANSTEPEHFIQLLEAYAAPVLDQEAQTSPNSTPPSDQGDFSNFMIG